MLNTNINIHTETRQKAVEKIIYDLALEFDYGNYSTLEPFDIDYKFWADVGVESIANALAAKLADAEQTIHELAMEGTR